MALKFLGYLGFEIPNIYSKKDFLNGLALIQHVVQTIRIYVAVQTRRGRSDFWAENIPTWYVNFV